MDWVKPDFSDFLCPPRKKLRTEDSPSQNVFKNSSEDDSSSEQSETSIKLSLLSKYSPRTKEELVVNKKKIEELESWLKNYESEASYLLITGPPGCGKLRTLIVLCKFLKIDVIEWTTPVQQDFDRDNYNPFYQNELQKFEDFITRGSRYTNVLSQSSRRIVVIKDIPNSFLRNNEVFHKLLETYFGVEKMRIAFIISDFSVCRDLFPENIKMKFMVKNISFNPITERCVSMALLNLVKKFELHKINSNINSFIEKISSECQGDLRNAIATLQFLLVKRTFESMPLSSTKSIKAKVGKSKTKRPTPKSDSSVSTVCDNKIDIFHGLGRILYAKRENGRLVHNPQEVADSFTTCPQLLIGMLHENYLNTYSSIHDVAKASSNLAVSDILLHERYSHPPLLGYAVSISSHGLMTSNSLPIKKFQQFNKSRSKEDTLVKTYKDILELNNPLWKGLDILMDIAPFVKVFPHFSSPDKEFLLKLATFHDHL